MRKRIKDIRREELLLATLDTIHKEGLHNITVAKLSSTAGMSQGMVHHYFKNKAEIIEAAIRYVNTKLRDYIIAEINHSQTDRERLFKIIDANFADQWFNQDITRLWISFCAEVPFNPTFYRIQYAIHRRMRSNLLSSLKPLVKIEEAERISNELSNLIDGLWLRKSVNTSEISSEQAVHCIEQYLSQMGIER